MKIFRLMLLVVVLSLSASASISGPFTAYPSFGNILTDTDWFDTISLPKFNPALGTLTSISLTLGGTVVSDVQFESRDLAPTTITAWVTGTLNLYSPDDLLTPIVITIPIYNEAHGVTAYDNVLDYGGASGFSANDLTAATSNTEILTDGALLAAFTGAGNIDLPVEAFGETFGAGPGNLSAIIATQASGYATIQYTYDPAVAVPEPGSIGLAGSALLALAYYRRRRV
jgi:hypothetical protein